MVSYIYMMLIVIHLGGIEYPQPAVIYNDPQQCLNDIAGIDQKEKSNMRIEASCVAYPIGYK